MDGTLTYRESNRARLREALVAAARELTIAHGWDAVRMVDVARAVGVSRQTVYNEFGGRAGLAEALAVGEVERLLGRVRAELSAHGPRVRAAVEAAVLLTLEEAAGNPLARAVVTSGRGGAAGLLPYLTARSGIVLDAAGAALAEWAATHLPQIPEATVTTAADALVRLTVSHILRPGDTPAGTAATLAEAFAGLLGVPR